MCNCNHSYVVEVFKQLPTDGVHHMCFSNATINDQRIVAFGRPGGDGVGSSMGKLVAGTNHEGIELVLRSSSLTKRLPKRTIPHREN